MQDHFTSANFHSGIDLIQEVLREANVFVQDAEPWKLTKIADSSEEARNHLDIVLHSAIEVLRISGILLQPVIPKISTQLLDALRVEDRSWASASSWRRGEIPLDSKPQALFARMK